MAVGGMRLDVDEAETLREIVIGTEALEADWSGVRRRLEMCDLRDQRGHALVLFDRLARKSPDDVPERLDAKLFAPLQKLDVLQSAVAFAHQRQDRIAEALDARLQHRDAGVAQQLQLIFPDARRLHLVEQLDVQLSRREFRN